MWSSCCAGIRQSCLIDGLAYRNPPGSKHPDRWQDVEELLDAGISVITSINLQFIEGEAARNGGDSREKVNESVPEPSFAPPTKLKWWTPRPNIAPLAGQFELGRSEQRQLSELREIALVLAADVVDHQLEEYLQPPGRRSSFTAPHERILVCVTPRSSAPK